LYPEKLIRTYEEQKVDCYWQTYWVYIAYLKNAEIVKAEKALSRLNLYTKYPESNGYLLSALSSSFELDTAVAQDLLSVIPSSPCSAELEGFYKSLIYEFASQTAGEQDSQCHNILFYVENIIHMDNPYKKAEIKDRTERAIVNETAKKEVDKIVEKADNYYSSGDYSEAMKWYLLAAEQGHARAQFCVAVNYDEGKGVSQDYKEALKWYRKAAEQGDVDAQCNLGSAFGNGEGVEQDYTEAVKWFHKAAEQGNQTGQLGLAICYDEGYGVEQNYAEAAKWYRKAAEQGDAQAQVNLGFLYKNGNGVNQNYSEAAKWYRKAAEQDDENGQCNLGELYFFGKGVPKDRNEAKYWWEMAAKNGSEDALEYLNGKEPEL
jgi:TPR repeat protein